MQKLIKELNDSILWKSQDIARYTKMINLVLANDVKGIRKFIFENETCEKEMFYEYLQWGAPELFAKVYPNAEKQEGKYVTQIIMNQFEEDIKELDVDTAVISDEGSYPENYTSVNEDCCGGGCGCHLADDPGYDRKEYDFEG